MKKKINENGFSLVELLGVMVILGILISSSVIAYSRYRKAARIQAYDTMASSAADAAAQYAMTYPGTTSIKIEDLYNENFLSSLSDPGKKDKTCRGLVEIENIKSSNTTELDTQSYKVHICCKNYNYTYSMPEGDKIRDKYCREDPYDITQIKEIKVLNVYPIKSYANYFSDWMKEKGKNIIKVDSVYIDTFNSNPNKYLNENELKYDVIVFGFADCNGNKDLNDKSSKVTEAYLKAGGSAIFGHDTMYYSNPYFSKLTKYVGITLNGSSTPYISKVKINKEGIFTSYPYSIEKKVLTIPESHITNQIAHGDIWLTFTGDPRLSNDASRSFYLTTYGNNAFIQTGHTGGQATEDEQEILANIIFYTVAKRYS